MEDERRAKQAATLSDTLAAKKSAVEPELIPAKPPESLAQKIEPNSTKKNESSADAKIAEAVGTNRTYINQAAKIEAAAKSFLPLKECPLSSW